MLKLYSNLNIIPLLRCGRR